MSTEDYNTTPAPTSEKTNASKKKLVWGGAGVLVAVVAIAGLFYTQAGATLKATALDSLSPASAGKATPASADANSTAADLDSIKLGDPTVAVINGTDIKRSEVFAFISTLPAQIQQMPVQQLFPLALDQVVNNKIISDQAESAALESDEAVKALYEQAQQQIIRNVFLERQVESKITQKELLNAYNELLKSLEGVQETRASHILVASEDEARALIKQLDDGAAFEELAQEHSTDPGAGNGGDLGYFAKTDMVSEFADAAFAIDVGKHTKDPVQTQFGWHVIKVTDRRDRPEPEFEAVKPQLEAQLRQKALTDLLDGWQKDAKIKKFDINGEPVKAN